MNSLRYSVKLVLCSLLLSFASPTVCYTGETLFASIWQNTKKTLSTGLEWGKSTWQDDQKRKIALSAAAGLVVAGIGLGYWWWSNKDSQKKKKKEDDESDFSDLEDSQEDENQQKEKVGEQEDESETQEEVEEGDFFDLPELESDFEQEEEESEEDEEEEGEVQEEVVEDEGNLSDFFVIQLANIAIKSRSDQISSAFFSDFILSNYSDFLNLRRCEQYDRQWGEDLKQKMVSKLNKDSVFLCDTIQVAFLYQKNKLVMHECGKGEYRGIWRISLWQLEPSESRDNMKIEFVQSWHCHVPDGTIIFGPMIQTYANKTIEFYVQSSTYALSNRHSLVLQEANPEYVSPEEQLRRDKQKVGEINERFQYRDKPFLLKMANEDPYTRYGESPVYKNEHLVQLLRTGPLAQCLVEFRDQVGENDDSELDLKKDHTHIRHKFYLEEEVKFADEDEEPSFVKRPRLYLHGKERIKKDIKQECEEASFMLYRELFMVSPLIKN